MNLPIGTSPQKANFFREVCKGLEFLAMWYDLTVTEQEEVRAILQKHSATIAQRTNKQNDQVRR